MRIGVPLLTLASLAVGAGTALQIRDRGSQGRADASQGRSLRPQQAFQEEGSQDVVDFLAIGRYHPSQILDEIARMTPAFKNVSYAARGGWSVQWPCNDAVLWTPIMHIEGFARGKGKFVITERHGAKFHQAATDHEFQGPAIPYPYGGKVRQVRVDLNQEKLQAADARRRERAPIDRRPGRTGPSPCGSKFRARSCRMCAPCVRSPIAGRSSRARRKRGAWSCWARASSVSSRGLPAGASRCFCANFGP